MRSTATIARRLAVVIAMASLSACASMNDTSDMSIFSDASIHVVTARQAGRGVGPTGIADRFTTEGQVFAVVSFVWPIDHKDWGRRTFEYRWYSGDRLVIKREASVDIRQSPFNFWSSVLPNNLGPGKARYELYAGGKKLAEKTFEITNPT